MGNIIQEKYAAKPISKKNLNYFHKVMLDHKAGFGVYCEQGVLYEYTAQ
jgi:hypothetical protein